MDISGIPKLHMFLFNRLHDIIKSFFQNYVFFPVHNCFLLLCDYTMKDNHPIQEIVFSQPNRNHPSL